MKKFLLLPSMMITLTAISQTSVYHPFPDSSATWNFNYIQLCFGSGIENDNYSITISGDTVINSQTYHKLTTPYIQSFSTGTCGTPATGYRGAIRQDIANKKVFYVPPSASAEDLLYDFNMQAGDTVKGFLESFALPADTVQSIDSVLIGNDYRKRWNINPCYYISLIEGIGSTYGLIELSPGCVTDLGNYTLSCFIQNGSTLYPDTTSNCQLILSLQNNHDKTFLTNISPNPFHLSALLRVSSEFENAEMKIYDTLGILVRKEKISHQASFLLSRNELRNGIYFFQLSNEKKQAVNGKFMVQ